MNGDQQTGMLHNMGGIVAALILGFLFLPGLLVSNTQLGADLTMIWWIVLAVVLIVWRIRRRNRVLARPNTRHIPQSVKIAVSVRDGGRCVWCGTDQNIQFGHIVPFSQGGTATVDNIQLECQQCNLSKGDKYEAPITR